MYIYIYSIHIHIQRRGPKPPQGLASRTHGQPLQGATVMANMFQFQTFATLLKTPFSREGSLADS